MKNAVVTFLLRGNGKEVLLAQKHKESEIAGLKWNGYGGKMEKGEKPVEAAIREFYEETNGSVLLNSYDLIYAGCICFYNSDGVSDFRVHIFYGLDVFTQTPPGSEVMINPTWYCVENLNSLDMMPADKLFLPIILNDRIVIKGRVVFESGFKGVKEFSYEEISPKEISTLLAERQA